MRRSEPLRRKKPLERRESLSKGAKGLTRGKALRNPARALERAPEVCEECGAELPPLVRPDRERIQPLRCRRCLGRALGRSGTGGKAHGERNRERIRLPCPICGEEFETTRSGLGRRKTCSIACAAEWKRLRARGTRRGSANPAYKHGRKTGQNDPVLQARWRSRAANRCESSTCEGRVGKLDLHHVVYRQHLRLVSGDEYDPDNGITLCSRCHQRHHLQVRPLPLAGLPDRALGFAFRTLGDFAADYLRRRYAGDDPRIDAYLRRNLGTDQPPEGSNT